jgi:2'-5' RNA ligase
MTRQIRAFIAIELPDAVKRTATGVSTQLAAAVPDGSVRWVKPNAMHLTLRFLGDTAESLVPALSQAMDQAVAAQPAFTLALGQLGAFPIPQRPRVLWLGLRPVPPAAFGALKTAVDAALVPLGWAAETKPFTAHLTLGRVRDGRRLERVPWDLSVPTAAFPVGAIHLIESDLRPDGPRYTVRHSAALPAALTR